MRSSIAIILAAALAIPAALAPPANAADFVKPPKQPDDDLPGCASADVLAEVEDQFEYGAPRMLERDLEILEFSGMVEKAYFPQVEAEHRPDPQPIARRYCQGQALISDGKRRTVYYVIEYPMGFAAAGGFLGMFSPVPGWRAEGCVLGLDEWRVYGANCQSLRRFPPGGRTGYGYVGK